MPHKLPGSREVADRGKLVDLFEQTVTSSSEYRVLENYRKDMEKMLALEEHLDRLSAESHRESCDAKSLRESGKFLYIIWQIADKCSMESGFFY